MKEAKTILSHMRHAPQYKKLSNQACIASIKKLFPPHLQQQIRFGYIKQGILYFVLMHPGAKQEFDIILESIKTPLKLYMPQRCKAHGTLELKAFVSNKPIPPLTGHQLLNVQRYKERATGEFTVNKGSKSLQKEFLQSKTIISQLNQQDARRT